MNVIISDIKARRITDDMEAPASPKKDHTVLIVTAIASPFIILAILFCVWIVTQARETQQAQLAEQARLAADPITVSGIYNALNAERAKAGAPALTVLPNLTTGATQFCEDMRANNYFDYKNPTTGKDANSYITDNKGDLYLKTYVSSITTGDTATQTANDVIVEAVKNQATNLNNPSYNSIGWAICDSPQPEESAALIAPTQKYIVGLLAEKTDPPAEPTTIYQPVYQAPARTSVSCSSYELFGTVRTTCY